MCEIMNLDNPDTVSSILEDSEVSDKFVNSFFLSELQDEIHSSSEVSVWTGSTCTTKSDDCTSGSMIGSCLDISPIYEDFRANLSSVPKTGVNDIKLEVLPLPSIPPLYSQYHPYSSPMCNNTSNNCGLHIPNNRYSHGCPSMNYLCEQFHPYMPPNSRLSSYSMPHQSPPLPMTVCTVPGCCSCPPSLVVNSHGSCYADCGCMMSPTPQTPPPPLSHPYPSFIGDMKTYTGQRLQRRNSFPMQSHMQMLQNCGPSSEPYQIDSSSIPLSRQLSSSMENFSSPQDVTTTSSSKKNTHYMCGNCFSVGHNRRTCPNLNGNQATFNDRGSSNSHACAHEDTNNNTKCT